MNRYAPEQLPFFVYGTLLPGQPNYGIWGDEITTIDAAVLEDSQIYDMGYYPMLVAQKDEIVTGKLITVTGSSYGEILFRVDALEEYDPLRPQQSTYKRMRRKVTTFNGHKLEAWVYEGDRNLVNRSSKIVSGDWVAHFRGRQNEIEAWWESINTMYGHHK